MMQLATQARVPCAEIRAAEVRALYRARFPHEWVAIETAVCRELTERKPWKTRKASAVMAACAAASRLATATAQGVFADA